MRDIIIKIFAVIGVLSLTFIIIPMFTGILVSADGPLWLETDNEWIGFWGGYLGSLVGAITSLVGIFVTIRYTQNENKKERELMYRPHIKVCECKPNKDFHYISVETGDKYVIDGRNCQIGIQIKNVGLGPIVDFKIADFEYHSNKYGNKKVPVKCVFDEVMEKDDFINLMFQINLDIHDNDLAEIDLGDTSRVTPFLNYGGDLKFRISGKDLCNNPFGQDVVIHVQGQIMEENGYYKYFPEVYLR